MKNRIIKLTTAYLVLFLSILVPAQSGGNFTIEQSVIGGGGQSSAGGTFSIDGTIGQPLAGNGLSGGSFSVTSGFWSFTPSAPNSQTYEADVAPRPNGNNGLIEPADVIQVQRFQIGLDQADLSNEFQRADSAPFDSRGDGMIQPNDIVQAQRYQIGLDLQQFAAGPSAPPAPAPAPSADNAFGTIRVDAKKNAAAPREIRVESPTGSFSGGQTVVVNIRVDAVGDESAYGFTLDYDQTALTSPSVMIGTAGGSRFCNTTTVAGQIKCSINNFPDNNPASDTDQIGEIAAGNNQLLVKITFTVVANAAGGDTLLRLSNAAASNDKGDNLTPITTTDGKVTILGPTAAAVTVVGRVITQTGRGIVNVQITMTDTQGNQRRAISTAFGYFRFREVAAGETYIFTIKAKRFTFTPSSQVRSISGDIDYLMFIADN